MNRARSIDKDFQATWQSFTEGNQKAFTTIYHACFQDLFRYGMHFHPDKSVVKECIQDMFVKLWNNRQNISEVDHVQYYLFRSLRNTILTKISSQAKYGFYELQEESYHFEISYPQEHHLIVDEEQLESYQRFRLAMDKLTPRQREIIYLRYMKGLAYEQAASVMNITVKAAYKLVARSLDTLKENLHKTPSQWPQLFLLLSLLSLFN